MAHTFTFRTRHSYDTTKTGITIPVELSDGLKVIQINPKPDTGASFCIFERTYREMLGWTWRAEPRRSFPLPRARSRSSATG